MNKFLSLLKTTFQKISYATLALVIFTQMAFAVGIPKMEAPSRGEGGGIMETIKNYAFDAFTLAGLIICSFAFFKVAGAAIEAFGEAREKNKWGPFAVTSLIGVVLIVVIIWLITKALEIL